jgi:hypothetical protein
MAAGSVMVLLFGITWIFFVYRRDPYVDLRPHLGRSARVEQGGRHRFSKQCGRKPVTTLGWMLAIAALPLCYAAGELAARWWIRHRSQYYVLPPGLRLRLHIDSQVFPQLERETRLDVNSDGERGDDLPRSSHGLYRVLVAVGVSRKGSFWIRTPHGPGRSSARSNGRSRL